MINIISVHKPPPHMPPRSVLPRQQPRQQQGDSNAPASNNSQGDANRNQSERQDCSNPICRSKHLSMCRKVGFLVGQLNDYSARINIGSGVTVRDQSLASNISDFAILKHYSHARLAIDEINNNSTTRNLIQQILKEEEPSDLTIKLVNSLDTKIKDPITCSICQEDIHSSDFVMGWQCLHLFHSQCILRWAQTNARQFGDMRPFFTEGSADDGSRQPLPDMANVFPSATCVSCPECRLNFCDASYFRRSLNALEKLQTTPHSEIDKQVPSIEEVKELITSGMMKIVPAKASVDAVWKDVEMAVPCGDATAKKKNFSLFDYSNTLKDVGFNMFSIVKVQGGESEGKAWCRYPTEEDSPFFFDVFSPDEQCRELLNVSQPTYCKSLVVDPESGFNVPKIKSKGGWWQMYNQPYVEVSSLLRKRMRESGRTVSDSEDEM
jgi:hypothetical protein